MATKPAAAAASLRSRIIDSGVIDPRELVANPRNWRTHPPEQRAALEAELDRVGWVQGVMVNRTTGHLVDGHLRADVAAARGWSEIPVTWVELARSGFGPSKRTDGHRNTTLSGDTIVDWSPAFELVPSLEVAYVWHAGVYASEVAIGLQRLGFEIRAQIIWAKTQFAMSRGAYHWQHEPCWYAVRKGCTAKWVGPHDLSTLWELASPKMIMGGSHETKEDHPAQKPVECTRRPIAHHEGDVYEPFSGSGTTIIASEMEGRRCFAMELAPRYVQVAIERWQAFTGREAVRG